LGKTFFAERLALGKDVLCRERAFAERLTLGKDDVLCRATSFTEGTALGNEIFAERSHCREGPALGEGGLCRTPDD